MKKTKKLVFFTFALVMNLFIMNGCTYAKNQNWDDLTPKEQEEVRQTLHDVKEDLETMYPEDSIENVVTDVVSDKLDRVAQELEKES